MEKYHIAGQVNIDGEIEIYLLPIEENIKHINKKIIPTAQLDEISLFKYQYDIAKRLLCRSFLFEFLSCHYHITDFEMGCTEFKKPFLKANPGIHFSFSYAHAYCLIGISAVKQIGIDIEFINPALPIREMADSIMCPLELELFTSLAGNDLSQRNYFFKLFSAKESIVKAFGTGLHFDVKHLNTLDPAILKYKDNLFTYRYLDIGLNEYTMALCYQQE